MKHILFTSNPGPKLRKQKRDLQLDILRYAPRKSETGSDGERKAATQEIFRKPARTHELARTKHKLHFAFE